MVHRLKKPNSRLCHELTGARFTSLPPTTVFSPGLCRCLSCAFSGTMDEGEFACLLEPVVKLATRPRNRSFYLVLVSHDGRALVPIPKRSASP